MNRHDRRCNVGWLFLATLGSAALAVGAPAEAQLAISANDNKLALVNGVAQVVQNPAPDTITIIDLRAPPPRVVAEIPVPTSVVGPPLSVAITPDEGLALVTSAMKIDPADKTKQVPDNKVSVIDLKATPPRVIATLEAGAGAAGLSINRQGTLALVANRSEGTVSVFGIQGKTVTPVGKVTIAPGGVGGEPRGVHARRQERARHARRRQLHLGALHRRHQGGVHQARSSRRGCGRMGSTSAATASVAVVANIGRGGGDNDTISLIDLKAKPPRVVETVTVGQTPEGIMLSPDGKLAAVIVMNGSNKAEGVAVLQRRGQAGACIGSTARGSSRSPRRGSATGRRASRSPRTAARSSSATWWSAMSRCCAGTATSLTDRGERIRVNGGSAALRTADRP